MALSGAGVTPAVVTLIQQSLPFLSRSDRLLSLRDRLRVAVVGWEMRRSAKRATRVVVQTDVMRREVMANFGVDPARIDVVTPDPEAVIPSQGAPELERLRRAPEGLRVLYVGSARPHKNLATLMKAFMRAKASLPDLTLFLTEAHGPQIPQFGSSCPGAVAATGRVGSVSSGFVSRDALVIETVGLPLLEAFASGLPVVSDRPFAREICGQAALFSIRSMQNDRRSLGASADQRHDARGTPHRWHGEIRWDRGRTALRSDRANTCGRSRVESHAD